ncbi:DNA-deoxyinosine glycosylase [Lysobacter sp. TY2-98]|uniref:DNA-deoxyinosine glycosylase n=1 Tax=Lysobacter sp. TY2-98 TaxID=2290922 RepID=UPI000E20A77A|nr:DNA-deoxyinosine glycosylase [Lysobacter sp. TY2-98]AXK71919.1 DNA-deoxyinosine glycosylase [Lysobacter sp. TY2-98]
MTRLHGLPPIENPEACALVLGSMPGGASLRAARYYAHPQNLFWTFMGDLVGASPVLPYDVRVQHLRDAGIALWDVIGACEREGSLDSAIRGAVANDFATFFATHTKLRAVLFNGATAETTFRRQLPDTIVPADVALVRLPSTSPANRSIPTETKRLAWRDALAAAGVRVRPLPPV